MSASANLCPPDTDNYRYYRECLRGKKHTLREPPCPPCLRGKKTPSLLIP